MSIKLESTVVQIIEDKNTLKIVSTVDENGVPNASIKQSLYLNKDGNIEYLELLESSKTNKNLANSIWFDKKVSILLKADGDLSYEVKGKPIKALIAGEIFQEKYVNIREKLGDVDLAAVWIIEPEEVINKSYFFRKDKEELERPYFKHLDRLRK